MESDNPDCHQDIPKPQADEDPPDLDLDDLDDPDDLPNIANFTFSPPRTRAQSPIKEQTESGPQLVEVQPAQICQGNA